MFPIASRISSTLLVPALLIAAGSAVWFGAVSHAGGVVRPDPVLPAGPGCTPSGSPQPLYVQTDAAAAVATNSQNFEAQFNQFDDQAADDFDVQAGQVWSVTQVNVRGQYQNGSGSADSVNVFFYPNSGSLPGAPAVCTYTALPMSNEPDFNISLPTPCILSGGRYWVSVQANMNFSPNGQWYWVDRTVQKGSLAAFRNPGGGFGCPGGNDWVVKSNCISPTFPDQIFSIIGTILLGCPTPTPTPPPTPTPSPTPSPGCNWSASTDYPINIADEAAVALGGNIYVFGGTSNNAVVRTSMKFNGTTWTPIANLPFALRGLAAVTDGTSIYLVNGENNTGIATASLTKYNPAANNYTILTSPSIPTSASACVLLSGKLYRIAGLTLPGTTKTVEAYSISGNSWSQLSDFPASVGYPMAVPGNGVLYAGGGVEESGVDSLKTYSYDPVLDTWNDVAIADLPVSPAPHWGAASALLGGRWTIGPGGSAGLGQKTAIQWDPITNVWTSLPDSLAPRYRLAGASLGSSMYAIGGDPPTGSVNDQKLTCIGTPISSPTPTPTVTPTPSCVPPPLYDNGPLVTDPGAGFGHADACRLQSALGMSILGFLSSTNPERRLADDFTVPAGGWTINTMTFYGYQTASLPTSTFNDVRVQIWNGPPNAGGTVIFGDTTTNRFAYTSFTNIYRVPDTNLLDNQRPIMAIVANINTTLPAGTYWVDAELGGDPGFSGPFVPPVTILGQTGKPGANALQWNGSSWVQIADVSAQDVPFKINETFCSRRRARADFDGDHKTDISVFRPAEGTWYLQRSMLGFTAAHFGEANDIVRPGDYDGDGKTDIAVFRPTDGNWYILNSSNGAFTASHWGVPGDVPLSGDFDGDGRTDLTIFRPAENNWYILRSTAGFISANFGSSGDVPLVMDPNGDGVSNIGVFRPSNNTWYVAASLVDPSHNFTATAWGQSGDSLVPADYDGDGRDDIAVFRSGNGVWYVRQSINGQLAATQFGQNGDVPVPGDYDGDGRDDQAVFRAGTWYLNRSTSGFASAPFGTPGDRSVPKSYIP